MRNIYNIVERLKWFIEYAREQDHGCDELPNMRHCSLCQGIAEAERDIALFAAPPVQEAGRGPKNDADHVRWAAAHGVDDPNSPLAQEWKRTGRYPVAYRVGNLFYSEYWDACGAAVNAMYPPEPLYLHPAEPASLGAEAEEKSHEHE